MPIPSKIVQPNILARKYSFIVLAIFSLTPFFLLKGENILAQVNSSGLAVTTPIIDTEASDGDIICTYDEGNTICNKEYDPSLYGVITDNPSISLYDEEVENGKFVITSGITRIKVSTRNGFISEGDFITSSVTSGVGQKATRNGYVVGIAMENYASDNIENIGKIQIMLNIHPAAGITGERGNLLQFIREGIAVPIFQPLESFRYLLAILIILVSFTLGMIYFGRTSRAGIEAVGRNPLAKRVIQLTVLLNIGLTIVIILVGLAIAYLILTL